MSIEEFEMNIYETSKICGTKEYYSPEKIRKELYNTTYDWWCLGILIYELLEGKTPFEDENIFVSQNKILNSKLEFNKGQNYSSEC